MFIPAILLYMYVSFKYLLLRLIDLNLLIIKDFKALILLVLIKSFLMSRPIQQDAIKDRWKKVYSFICFLIPDMMLGVDMILFLKRKTTMNICGLYSYKQNSKKRYTRKINLYAV